MAGLAAVACAVIAVEFAPALLHRGEPQVAVQNSTPVVPQVAPLSVPSAESQVIPPARVALKNSAQATPAASSSKPSRKIESSAKMSSNAPVARREITNRDGAQFASTRQDAAAEDQKPPADPAGAALHTATRAASQLASVGGAAINSASGDTQPSHDNSRPVPASRASSAATHSASGLHIASRKHADSDSVDFGHYSVGRRLRIPAGRCWSRRFR